MSSKIRKKMKAQKSQHLEVDTDAVKILRKLDEKEAFYFYENIGKPIGENARSLSDFLEKIKSVKLESLLFHLKRKDFQNWINETLGDNKLAQKIARISPSHDDVRKKIRGTIENRMEELREASVTLLVNEDLTVASPISPS